VAIIDNGRGHDIGDWQATTAGFTQDCRLVECDAVELRSINLHDRLVVDCEDLRHPALADEFHPRQS
jgi:hypothetical protein